MEKKKEISIYACKELVRLSDRLEDLKKSKEAVERQQGIIIVQRGYGCMEEQATIAVSMETYNAIGKDIDREISKLKEAIENFDIYSNQGLPF